MQLNINFISKTNVTRKKYTQLAFLIYFVLINIRERIVSFFEPYATLFIEWYAWRTIDIISQLVYVCMVIETAHTGLV